MIRNPITIIPARMASTRLPGKPLALIGGVPMIVHVLRRAQEAGIGPVLVACADQAIADVTQKAGGTAILTDPALPSGSDRVAAALAAYDPHGEHDAVVNLQGDLPTIPPDQLRTVLDALRHAEADIATLVARIETIEDVHTPSVVKAACAFGPGQRTAPALYFSRAPIPWGDGPHWHHIGVYAYRRAALARFVALPASALEQREGLEQLRALEAGMRIVCGQVAHAPFGVDTPPDLERARAALQPAPTNADPVGVP